jgi:hypothetical protein
VIVKNGSAVGSAELVPGQSLASGVFPEFRLRGGREIFKKIDHVFTGEPTGEPRLWPASQLFFISNKP